MSVASNAPRPRRPGSLFSSSDLESIQTAIQSEIAATIKEHRSALLDIDAIEHLANQPGHFVYRLILSSPILIAPDQRVRFLTQRPRLEISATVIKADEEGLVVECQKALPVEAKFVSMSFDPAFILVALHEFLEEVSGKPGVIAGLVYTKSLPSRPVIEHQPVEGLNQDQASAISEMEETPLYLLWGPPGTGKTTTVGAAVARWMRQGKDVLVVSTSNAAVDVAMRAVLSRTKPEERRHLLRLGTSLDIDVGRLTLEGKLAEHNQKLAERVAKSQGRITEINEQIRSTTPSPTQLHNYVQELADCEAVVREFIALAEKESARLLADVRVTGCTLARMVLEKAFRDRRFDVAILDEASMASFLYALGTSMLARRHLVYAGDPKQLPPIVQTESPAGRRWFGQNIYEWFGVEMQEAQGTKHLKLLQTQYRMTNRIGGLVSRLSYHDMLRHARNKEGPLVEFIELPREWESTQYSITEGSYYHLAAVPVLHAIKSVIRGADEVMLLSPFRPQRSLLAALAYDLKDEHPQCRIIASTIHRSQGSECKVVVVDLTAHDPAKPVSFFTDVQCSKLINVALSRAKDRLLIVGSRMLLEHLAAKYAFWKLFIGEFGSGISHERCSDLLDNFAKIEDLSVVAEVGRKDLPAIYSHSSHCGPIQVGLDCLSKVTASRKLLVVDGATPIRTMDDIIVRQSMRSPEIFMAGGQLCLRYNGRWIVARSPNVTRVVWRIAFSHLADDELNPNQAKRFSCSKCPDGDLMLNAVKGEGLYLICTNSQNHRCYYRRRPSLDDAKALVQMHDMKCRNGHPMTARSGPSGFFIGCENYPHCEERESFSLLTGS